ncbi:MAG: hypothetical protein ACRDT4_23535, partial [Micromonosporaceae bacterium]
AAGRPAAGSPGGLPGAQRRGKREATRPGGESPATSESGYPASLPTGAPPVLGGSGPRGKRRTPQNPSRGYDTNPGALGDSGRPAPPTGAPGAPGKVLRGPSRRPVGRTAGAMPPTLGHRAAGGTAGKPSGMIGRPPGATAGKPTGGTPGKPAAKPLAAPGSGTTHSIGNPRRKPAERTSADQDAPAKGLTPPRPRRVTASEAGPAIGGGSPPGTARR